MVTQYLSVTWPEYHLLSQKLAAAIFNHSSEVDLIVAISRGGLTLGHLLSDLMMKPISTILIQSYTDIQLQGEVKLVEKLQTPIVGKRVLIVDDAADTGKTFHRAIEHLKAFKPKELITVSLYYKPHSSVRPDFYAKQTKKWIIFPYESTEMIMLITKQMEKEGKSKAQIQDFLTGLGLREGQIAFTRKHHLLK